MRKGTRPSPLDQPRRESKSSPVQSPSTNQPSTTPQSPRSPAVSQSGSTQATRPPVLSRRHAAPRLPSGLAQPLSPRGASSHNANLARSGSKSKDKTSSVVGDGILDDAVSDASPGAAREDNERRASDSQPESPQVTRLRMGYSTSSPMEPNREMEAAFATPPEFGAQSASTISTESNRTVRATPMEGSGQTPVRTPSYPFPYVSSGVNSRRSTPLHQPFTVLSPTGMAEESKSLHRMRQSFASHAGLSSSRKSSLIRSDSEQTQQLATVLFPTPDLYDLVLQLNAEPNLESWWSRLTAIMRDQYKAHRMSLAIPADTTDVENVPWAQLAAYNAFGLQIGRSDTASASDVSWASSSSASHGSEVADPSLKNIRSLTSERPSIPRSRSYAGGDDVTAHQSGTESSKQGQRNFRPVFPRSMTSHPTGLTTELGMFTHQEEVSSPATFLGPEQRDEHDRSRQSISAEHISIIHSIAQPLDRENDALLEPGSVNRVLDRASVVLLTRDFNADNNSKANEGDDSDDEPSSTAFNVGLHKRSRPRDKPDEKSLTKYEDHEQLPAHPWSQSPAPSPAMQNDPNENPFFNPGEVSEDAFEPTPTKEPDYSRGFEAIGIDHASTVIHIPLVHPLLSRSLGSNQKDGQSQSMHSRRGEKQHSGQSTDVTRKVPIAILSILSTIVPYPRNWTQSIDLLGPHLATSFQTCYQNSAFQERIDRALQGNQRLRHMAQLPLEGTDAFVLGAGLDTLLPYDDDGSSSTIGSIASPSEGVSTHSGQSPIGSVTGTPSLAAPDSPSSYFDVKKRRSLERSKSSSIVPTSIAATSAVSRPVSTEHRNVLRKLDAGSSGSREERKSHSKRDTTPKGRDSSTSSTSRLDIGSAGKLVPQHLGDEATKLDPRFSVLHSNGADFKTSFPSLPMAAIPKPFPSPSMASWTALTTSPLDNKQIAPSDRLLRILIDALPVQVFIAHPNEGHLTWVNSKYLAYGGLTASEVYTKQTWETVHPGDVKECRELWVKHLRTGQQFQHKVRLRRFDGTYRHHYVRAAPLRNVDQRIVHWVGTITDFHDQHVAEMNASKQQETAQSEAKYRALANSSPQIVFAAKRHKGIIFCNSQWQAYSGQSEEDSTGLGFMECVYPDDLVKCNLPDFSDEGEIPSNVPISLPSKPRRTRSSAESSSEMSEGSGDTIMATTSTLGSPVNMQMPQRKLSELATQGILKASKDATGKTSYSTEVRLRSSNGEYRWHLVRVLLAEPLIQAEFSDEVDETWYGTCTDINDHKELEKTLKDTMDAKSRFLSNMSHEIRTPLNGIWGMTNFLIDSNLTSEQADHVNVIRASTEGLRDLINDILDLSKVEAGMIKLNRDWLHIRSVIEEVNDLLSTMALEKGLELNYLVDRDVPSMLKGDRFRLRQVLLNLIGNAIKFTQEGEVFVRCQKLPTLPEDRKINSALIQVDIMDTGRGFSDQEADMLFKRFSQIDGSSTRQHGGTGLGLAISMQLVELHGGTMTASSTVGKGSCFTFTVQFGLPTESDRPPGTPVPGLDSATSQSLPEPLSPPDDELLSPRDRSKQILGELEMVESPQASAQNKPNTPSSAGSEMSARSALSGKPSTKSSQSSISSTEGKPMRLEIKPSRRSSQLYSPIQRTGPLKESSESIPPLLYSILVISPLPWSRDAAVGHLDGILEGDIPHTVTARATVEEAEILTGGNDPLNFTHIMIIIKDSDAARDLATRMLRLQSPTSSVVIVSDMDQKRAILNHKEGPKLDSFVKSRRLQFVQKPMKPSRLAVVFDPAKQRELSTDVNQSSAQLIAATQKQVLDDTARRLGGRGIKVLLVEDNKINQMVMLKLLQRVSVSVETALDGQQATDLVFGKPPGYFSIILMDLMMPNKDGYESCREIRAWERDHKYAPHPIVALSANVLDDVWRKCKEAGFNSYLTKPLQFTELSEVMTQILDPEDPNQPLMTMRGKSDFGLPSSGSGVGTSRR